MFAVARAGRGDGCAAARARHLRRGPGRRHRHPATRVRDRGDAPARAPRRSTAPTSRWSPTQLGDPGQRGHADAQRGGGRCAGNRPREGIGRCLQSQGRTRLGRRVFRSSHRGGQGRQWRSSKRSAPTAWRASARPRPVARRPSRFDLRAPTAFVLGHETARPRPRPAARRGTVTLPMQAGESLNVAMAGTALLFEAARQRRVGVVMTAATDLAARAEAARPRRRRRVRGGGVARRPGRRRTARILGKSSALNEIREAIKSVDGSERAVVGKARLGRPRRARSRATPQRREVLDARGRGAVGHPRPARPHARPARVRARSPASRSPASGASSKTSSSASATRSPRVPRSRATGTTSSR